MIDAMPALPGDAHAVLAQAGLRATPPRLAIWRVLRDANDEPDAVDVLRRAQSLEPRTSLGTVYRFLRELESLGLAKSRPVAHQRSRWQLVGTSVTDQSSESAAATAVARLAATFGFRLVPARERAFFR